MNIWKWFTGHKTQQQLNALVSSGFVDRQFDPDSDLVIYKYTHKFTAYAYKNTQFDQNLTWSPMMLSLRGAVYDRYGNKINGNMNKFFNHNEAYVADIGKDFVVQEKLDGSCVQVFIYKGKPIVTTLGSFTSNQAKAAKKWLEKTYGFDWIKDDLTYVFEWMEPDNFTTLTYKGDPKLVLIAIFANQLGFEYSIGNFHWGWKGEVAKNFPIESTTPEELAKLIKDDEEGYVLVGKRREDGQFARMKIKGEEFLRLHRAKWGITPLKIYEWTYNLSPRTVQYDDLDEETKAYVDTVRASFASKLAALSEQGREHLEKLRDAPNKHEVIKTIPKVHQSFVYAMLGGKTDLAMRQYIKMIRPKPDEYPLGGLDTDI